MKTESMDECILVCVYYGPNGERLIRRGGKMAKMLNCPLYVLTVDRQPKDEWDIEKNHFISTWKKIADELGAEQFIVKYNEKRPVVKVICEVTKQKNVTQIVLGQTAQSRLEEITKGSIVNVLLNELSFVDLHIVSVSRELNVEDGFYEKGIRAYLMETAGGFRLCFNHTRLDKYEGIFYKEVGTDFNNGVFKFMKDNEMIEVLVIEDHVKDINDRINSTLLM
ncbi:MAG: universal stress protein [Candidatus Pristimantibacillus sp.]